MNLREFLSLMEVTSILPVFLFNMGSAIVQMDSGGGDFEWYLTLFPVGNECFVCSESRPCPSRVVRVAKSVQIEKHCTALHYTTRCSIHYTAYFLYFLSKIRIKNGRIASFFRNFFILKFRPYKNEPTDFILITDLT